MDLNRQNLLRVKSILKKSSVWPSVLLKPGHLYIKIKGSDDFSNYDIYIYNEGIFFDPYLDPKTLEPFKGISGFSINLSKPIDWNRLK